MRKLKLKFKIRNYLAIFLLIFLASPVFSAQIFFDTKTTKVGVGEKVEVGVFVNSEKESINAYEAKIFFPNDILDVKEIRDGNSIVNFWIEKPKLQNGAIIFSGITPGGFSGEKGLILSAIFETKKEGIAKFEIKDSRILKNDGAGSEIFPSFASFELVVSKDIPKTTPTILEAKDTEPPEPFIPEVVRDQMLFDGQWFLVFNAQDKQSGVDHYEIRESRGELLSKVFGIKYSLFSKWQKAESPYVLNDQKLRSYVFVKAVDKAGNERIITIPPKNPLPWYGNWHDWVIIILVFCIMYLVFRGAYLVYRRQGERDKRQGARDKE